MYYPIVSITTVWCALGGGEIKRGRARAFWRGGDGFNISIDADRGVWFDHVAGQGGGVLDLIQLVLGGDRRAAGDWLRDFSGGGPVRKPAVSAAVRAAEELAWWRAEQLALLKRTGRVYRDLELHLARLAREADPENDEVMEPIWAEIVSATINADKLEAAYDRLEVLTPAEVRELRKRVSRGVAA